MAAHDGFPIVLTADRTLMAGYTVLLDGMMAASQTTKTPRLIVEGLLAPRAPHHGGQATRAALGLRRIEAALRAGGFGPEDLAVVDDAHLAAAIGPATRVIGVSSGEPTGLGMSSSTMVAVVGGDIYPHAFFRELMGKVRHLVATQAPQAKVLMGGPGAWQFTIDEAARREMGVDHVVLGYAEGDVAGVVRSLCDGAEVPPVIEATPVAPDAIPPILGASTMGVVETSRGCGLGCGFCTLAGVPMLHLPSQTILADVQTNVAAGQTSIALLSEDLFRYGAQGVRCQPEAVLDMLRQVRAVSGVRIIQADHVNLASIAQFSDDELAQVCRYLVGSGHRRPWVNVGIETASGELLRASGGAPKMAGVTPDSWGEFCAEHLRRACRAGFSPMASLVIGLPDETDADVQMSLDWTRSLADQPVTIFPVLYAPIHGQEPPRRAELRRIQWQLLRECYEVNFRGVPLIFWGDQTEAGVSIGKRLLLQALGKGQVAQWRWLFAQHYRRAPGEAAIR